MPVVRQQEWGAAAGYQWRLRRASPRPASDRKRCHENTLSIFRLVRLRGVPMNPALDSMLAFLRARFDEDDQKATRRLTHNSQRGHAAQAEVASKRIIAQICRSELMHAPIDDAADHGPDLAFAVLVLLVLAYDDHPDYRLDWFATP